MSREIKFRAWDKKDKVMVDFSYPYLSVVGERIRNYALGYDSEGNYRQQENIIYMQYTGLKDKNGVEIYEGDIILTADDIRKRAIGNWKPKMRIVEWTDNKEYKTGFNLGKAQDGKCEIIGNIYQNPKLLKEREDE